MSCVYTGGKLELRLFPVLRRYKTLLKSLLHEYYYASRSLVPIRERLANRGCWKLQCVTLEMTRSTSRLHLRPVGTLFC